MPLPRTSNKDLASILRHFVAIEERTDTTDGEGGFTTVWSTVSGYGNVQAAVWPIFSFQKAQYRSIDSEATHFIMVRGEISVTHSANRIVFDSRVFEILSIEDIQERGIKKQITCKERIN
jgi:head-tail adaptor